MVRHDGLADRLFGAPGAWRMRCCESPSCRHHWLDPVPVPADLPRLYERYYTHRPSAAPVASGAAGRYAEALHVLGTRVLGYRVARRSPLPTVLSYVLAAHPGRRGEALMRLLFAPCRDGGRLLEVGFGDGRTMGRLAALGWHVTGVEFDQVAIEQAKAAGMLALPGALEDQDLPAASYDAIVAGHVIEHLADPPVMLRAAARLLAPGGHLILITPNAIAPGHAWFDGDWRGLEPPRHLNIFTPSSLARLVSEAGLEVEVCRGTGRSQGIHRPSLELRRLRRDGTPLGQPISWLNRLGFDLVEVLQAAWAAFDRDRCEEIVLVGRRPVTAVDG